MFYDTRVEFSTPLGVFKSFLGFTGLNYNSSTNRLPGYNHWNIRQRYSENSGAESRLLDTFDSAIQKTLEQKVDS